MCAQSSSTHKDVICGNTSIATAMELKQKQGQKNYKRKALYTTAKPTHRRTKLKQSNKPNCASASDCIYGRKGLLDQGAKSVKKRPKSSLFDPERKNSCMFEAGNAQLRSKTASSIKTDNSCQPRLQKASTSLKNDLFEHDAKVGVLFGRRKMTQFRSKTTSSNTTQSRSVCWKAKNGSTSLQNVAFVYMNLEGFDFMKCFKFDSFYGKSVSLMLQI